MANRYAIYAYDNLHGGMHGFFDTSIIYADTDDEVLAIAEDMSYEDNL